MLIDVPPRLSSFLAVLALSATFLLGVPSPASACTCATPPASTGAAILDAPAAAEVGILLRRDGVWIAEVLHDAKGNLPDQVAILAPADIPGETSNDDECGVPWRQGTVASLVFTVNEDRGWLEADACSGVGSDDLRAFELPAGTSVAALTLNDPPDTGGWSGWLLVAVAGAIGLYVAKNWKNPQWRNAWFRPNNARNSPARRADDPNDRTHFGR
ncbi:MAG: hypothetical protein O3C27_03655 [Actinomycetota bacterium]|nr:hypothetical protein [Actinomycetota bacterium]